MKALALALAYRIDQEKPGKATALISRFGREAFYQIPFDSATRGRAGYRFVVAPADAHALKNSILSGSISQAEKDAHLLSDAALFALRSDRHAAFLELREQDMFAFERDRIIAPAASRLGLPIKLPL